MRYRWRTQLRRGLLLATVGVMFVYSFFPLYWMLISGFRAEQALFKPDLLPGPFSFRHYDILFRLTDFPTYYLNSVIVALVTTGLTIIVVTPMAYALVRSHIRGMGTIVRAMLFAYMFPALLLAIPIYIFFVKVGLDDTLFSLVVTHSTFTLPLGVWLMWGFFKGFPFEVEEAAFVDGCSRLQAIYHVIVPMTLPGVLTIAIFSFLLSWSDYVFALILVSSDQTKTVSYGLISLIGTYDANWGEMMAGTTLISLPLLVIFAFLGKYFVRGLTMGAVKS